MSLEKATDNILKICMGLKKSETFLVVYDRNKKRIVDFLLKKAKRICRKADKIKTPVAKFNGEEPPRDIAGEMKKYNVVVIITTRSLSHTDARRKATRKGVRIASMPGVTEDMIKRTLTADYKKIGRMCKKIYRAYTNKRKIRMVTKKGTDIIININKSLCKPFNDAGLYHKKGAFGNLPAGEIGFAPVQKNTEGSIVIDKTMAGIGKLKNDIKLEVKKGFVRKIYGKGEASKLKRLLKGFKDKNVYNIAEFSIGTNYKAKITGVTLEDEKGYGTAHVALGDNTSYPGGKVKAPVHLDGVISNPTIFVDGKKIMEEGKLLL